MQTSARNVFEGTVTAVHPGKVNAEVVIELPGGSVLTAVVTLSSIDTLQLEPGRAVIAMIKASWITLVSDGENVRFSARNQLAGTVSEITTGAVNSTVQVALDGGQQLCAVVTNSSVKTMKLAPGSQVSALIKASHIILGVEP